MKTAFDCGIRARENEHDVNHRNRQGYFFIEALVAMMIVSLALGGTLTSISTASSVARGNKRQFTGLILCEELMENLRHQWISSPDPVARILGQVDPDFPGDLHDLELLEGLSELGWRDTCVRCPWPEAFKTLYSGQYRIQEVLEDSSGKLKHVQPGTLFQLQVRVRAINQDETIVLVTFLPLSGVPGGE